VFSVAEERSNTEVTETLRVLCVEAFEATEDTEMFVKPAEMSCLRTGFPLWRE
jgi:hypothetical protein